MGELVQAESPAECLPIAGVQQIAVLDRGDGHPLAGEAFVPQRQQVVDGGKVIRRQRVIERTVDFDVEQRLPGIGRTVIADGSQMNGVSPGEKIVQGGDAADRRGQRRRDLRVADVCQVALAVGQHEPVDLGMQSFANRSGGSGKIDHQTVGVHAVDREAM